MAFPLEKILTVGAKEYCESVGKTLADYEMKGVHTRAGFSSGHLTWLDEDFSAVVPLSAEVVVEYRITAAIGGANITYTQCYANGTALIPRDNSNQVRDDNDLNRNDNNLNGGN
jgi:hypothetical protein